MEEELRVGEEGARGNTGEGSPTNKHSRVPNSEENDPGNEQFPGGPVPVSELHCSGTLLDPLFIGYTAAVYFHTSDIKINSWTTQAKKMRASMPPNFEVREVLRKLERAGLENMLPV